MSTTIQLGDLTFSDQDVDGWAFRSLMDWWGGTSNKLGPIEKPQGHGAFTRTRSLRTSRAISFEARFRGASSVEVEEAFDVLAAVGAEAPVRMTVSTDDGASWRTVTVEVTPVESTRNLWFANASVDLIADDPRRYALEADAPWQVTGPPEPGNGLVWPVIWPAVWPGGGSPGRITLSNLGKAPSAPEFVLVGGFSTALITCVETGARIGFDRPVPAGSEVAIDTKTRRAMLDGQSDVSRWLRWREWELVPPGLSRDYQFDVTDPVSPLMRGRVLSAWW